MATGVRRIDKPVSLSPSSRSGIVTTGTNRTGNSTASSISDRTNRNNNESNPSTESGTSTKRVHIKKPLNAFMLFMKDMRPRVQEECTLKESAAINQILGRKWHELPREKQAKYYEMARKEKELHHQVSLCLLG